MNNKYNYKNFSKWKQTQLEKLDLSLKGSIDAPIKELVTDINNIDVFCTTSSCSGRVTVVKEEYKPSDALRQTDTISQQKMGIQEYTDAKSKRKGSGWYLASHDPISSIDILQVLNEVEGCTKLKFEPFIMHIKCASLNAAYFLQKESIACGFRNTGITLGHQGRQVMLAVRGTLSLEVPLTDFTGKVMVSDDYVHYINNIVTDKFHENSRRTMKFHKSLKDLFPKLTIDSIFPNSFQNDTVCTAKKKCKTKSQSFETKMKSLNINASKVINNNNDENSDSEDILISMFS